VFERLARQPLVWGAPGNQRLQGVGVAHWRDALRVLGTPRP
jgi:hypothetical protein